VNANQAAALCLLVQRRGGIPLVSRAVLEELVATVLLAEDPHFLLGCRDASQYRDWNDYYAVKCKSKEV